MYRRKRKSKSGREVLTILIAIKDDYGDENHPFTIARTQAQVHSRLSLTITCEGRMNGFPYGPRSGRKGSGAQAWLLAPSNSATSAPNTQAYLSLSFHSNINTPCPPVVSSFFVPTVSLFARIMSLHTLIPSSSRLEELVARTALEGQVREPVKGDAVLYRYTLPGRAFPGPRRLLFNPSIRTCSLFDTPIRPTEKIGQSVELASRENRLARTTDQPMRS